MFDDSDKVGANVALLPGCTQGYIPNPVEGPREVYEDLGKVLLVLEMFVTWMADEADRSVLLALHL